MKVQTIYICEICNEDYHSEKDALHCEDRHLRIAESKPKYDIYDGDAGKFPFKIEVMFSNGVIKNYYIDREDGDY